MSKDKELLELAAKAADIVGIDGVYPIARDSSGCVYGWNPLTDDGDALRLAVKLKMTIDVRLWDDEVQVRAYHEPSMYHISEKGDPCEATRRAIVRAAAEIGRGME